MLDAENIAQACADTTGLKVEKCREIVDVTLDTMAQVLKASGKIMVEGFGTFQNEAAGADRGATYADQGKGRKAPGKRTVVFRPAATMVAAMDSPQATPGPTQIEPPVATNQEPLPGKITPIPLREEDREIIDLWIRTREEQFLASVNEDSIFDPTEEQPEKTRRRPRFNSESTAALGRATLQAFARRCPVPLTGVGLTGDPGDLALFEHGSLHKEVVAYSLDYKARAIPRLARHKRTRARDGVDRDVSWRLTGGWVHFVHYAYDHFEWQIESGLRPPGSNPIRGIRKGTVTDYAKGKRIIVKNWYSAILRHPHQRPRERAILALLSNGLRSIEIVRAMIEHLDLKNGTLHVIGKSLKERDVPLMPWTIRAIDEWLQARRHSVNPRLFPGKKLNHPRLSRKAIPALVARITARVFPRPDQEHIRQQITPHGFRHYFVTRSVELRVPNQAIMVAVGHETMQMIQRYTHASPTWVGKEYDRVSNKRFW